MATAEAETSRDEQVPPGGLVYDGFISYSHAADDLLAPRLQAGLQRFAKPWWKRRALRIFRDESSLSANPHLWSSITDALDQSGWFVLLLSPEAARSPWVNNEVEYWLEHKDADKIIPVLTDGDFTWANADVAGDAFPPALVGAFADEPRWVDVRFGRTDEQLDLNNPEFSAAVADIASAIRGVPKEELASEEVRQHRRTVRTAWAAGIALLALVVLAGAAAIYANGQRSEANGQRIAAEASAAAEAEARAAAETAAEAEGVARADAEEQADVAKSRELAASAVSVLDDNPELAMLLALESIEATPPGLASSASGVLALREAMRANQLVARFPLGGDGLNFTRMTGDGSTVFVWYPTDGTVSAVDVTSGSVLWTHQEPTVVDGWGLVLSPDEDLLALSLYADSTIPEGMWGAGGPGDQPARVVILRTDTGRVETVFHPGPCRWPVVSNGFSPDGRWLMVATGSEGCRADPTAEWIAVYDTATWVESHRLTTEEGAHRGSFSAASDRVLVNAWDGPVELRSFPELELISGLGEASTSRLSPDGRHALLSGPSDSGAVDLRPRVVDITTGQQLFFLDRVDDFLGGEEIKYSPDGSKIVATTRGHDYVFDARDGQILTDLGEPGFTSSASFTDDGNRLLTSVVGSALLWDIGGTTSDVGVPIDLTALDANWINNGNQVADGPHLAVNVLAELESGLTIVTAVLDPQTGSVSKDVEGKGAQLPDGRFVVALQTP
jgi:outer membrane protein assembly factor BamB